MARLAREHSLSNCTPRVRRLILLRVALAVILPQACAQSQAPDVAPSASIEVRGLSASETAYTRVWTVMATDADSVVEAVCLKLADTARNAAKSTVVDWAKVRTFLSVVIADNCAQYIRDGVATTMFECSQLMTREFAAALEVVQGKRSPATLSDFASGLPELLRPVLSTARRPVSKAAAKLAVPAAGPVLLEALDSVKKDEWLVDATGRSKIALADTVPLVAFVLVRTPADTKVARLEMSTNDSLRVLPYDDYQFDYLSACEPAIDSVLAAR